MDLGELGARVRSAHADAWEVEGRARILQGGGWARFRDVRLMASGIPKAKWNNADITGGDADLDRVADWYAARNMPWGIRVPLDLDLSVGQLLSVKRCVGIPADAFHDRGSDVRVRRGADTELELIATLDAMESDLVAESRAWIAPQLGARGFTHWIAEVGDRAVGLATTVRSNGDAGRAAYVTGVFARDDEVLEGLVAAAVAEAFDDGVELVHANPGDDAEAERFLRLGAVEVPGFRVRLVRPD